MKIKTLSFAILLLCTASQFAYAQIKDLKVKVFQFQKEVKAVNSVYELKPAEFILHFDAENTSDFLIGATFDDDLFRSAKGEADLEVAWYQNTGMAEDKFNSDKQILVSNEAPSFWYYETKNDHRFDKKPSGNKNKWSATRSINTIYDLNIDKEINIKHFRKSLFLIFYNNKNNSDNIYEENGVDQSLISILSKLELKFNK